MSIEFTEQQYKEYARQLVEVSEYQTGLDLDLDTKVLLQSIIITNSKHFFDLGKKSMRKP